MKQFIAALSLLLLISCTTSKRLSYLTVPPETTVAAYPIDLELYAEKYKDYDGVYLNVEEIIEHSGTKENMDMFSKWDYTQIRKKSYLILNPDNIQLGSYRTYYKAHEFYIRITNPDGSVKMYGNDDLKNEKDIIGDDIYTFIFPNITKGSIVEYGTEISFGVSYAPPPLDHDINLQFDIPCEQLSFKYMYPDWWEIQLKRRNQYAYCPAEFIDDFENKKKILQYTASNIPALEWEPYSPEFKQVATYLEFMVKNLKMGTGSFDRPADWNEIAEEFYKYVIKKSDHKKLNLRAGSVPLVEKDISTLQEFTNIITENTIKDIDKIDAIITYIQDNIKVSSKSHDGNNSKIITDQQGNRYDITALAKNMIESVGIRSDYLLVHSEADGYFDPDYVMHSQMYIPAVRVITQDDTLVLFPYMEHLPLGHTPSYFQGETALIIGKETLLGMWTIPKGNRLDNIDFGTYEINIHEDGIINISEEKKFTGSIAYELREELIEMTDDEKKKFVEKNASYADGDITWETYEFKNIDKHREDLIISMKYSINNLVTITPEEIIVQTAGLLSPITNNKYQLSAKNRQNPIYIRYDQTFSKNIKINYPSQWVLTSELNDVKTENMFGELSKSHTADNGSLVIDINLVLKRLKAEKDKYIELLDLTGNNTDFSVPALLFEQQTI